MGEQRALWVATSVETKGGIATYVRAMQRTQLWTDWNIRHVVSHRDGSRLAKVVSFARGAAEFVLEITRAKPSVVHLHGSIRGSFLRKAVLFWISHVARIPVVIHMHGSGFGVFYRDSPRWLQRYIEATLRRASMIVALGEGLAATMRSIAPSARITVIPNAVSLAPRVSQVVTDGPVQVVFLGRIGDHKGTFELIEAWSELMRRGRPGSAGTAMLTIAGDGETERARNRIAELDLGHTVEVREWLSESDVCKLLDHAHVLVLPSRNEGQPMAVLEAMARGLCVIASDVGGLPEMIGGGCGLLVAPRDVESIYTALRQAVDDEELRTRCGAAAHRRVSTDFDASVVWQQVDALYRRVAR